MPPFPDHVVFAVNNDDVSEVKKWVENHPKNLNSKDRNGCSLLHYAAIDGAEKVVNYLLDAGASALLSEKHGSLTLCLMLATHPSLSSHPEEEEKYLRIAIRLIENGAPIGYSSKYDAFPLYFAARDGSTKFVDLLVRHGADVNASPNRFTRTPFLIAVDHGKRETAEQLKNLGADIYARYFDQGTAIHSAVGHPEMVQFLIKWGINPNSPDTTNRTPLFKACEEKYEKTVSVLLNNGVDTSSKVTIPTEIGTFESMTALEFCRFKKYDTLAKMIEDYDSLPEIKEPEED